MAKHSELTKADDLHYAKAKVFDGAITDIIPDFINQLLVSSDNELYRATGTNKGELVQVAKPAENTHTEQVFFFSGNPADVQPGIANTLYIATDTKKLYYSTNTDKGSLTPIAVEHTASAAPPLMDYGDPLARVPDYLGQQFYNLYDSTFWIAVSLTVDPKWRKVETVSQLYEPFNLDFTNYFANAKLFTGIPLTLHGNNTGYTMEVEPTHHDDKNTGHSAWFKWQTGDTTEPTTSVAVSIVWEGDSSGNNNADLVFTIFTGTALNDLTVHQYSNDINGNLAYIDNPPIGTVYYIKVETLNNAQGTFVATVNVP